MAINFTMGSHRNKDILKIELKGDLDASSAWQIIHALKKDSHGINKIIIQTSQLKHIYPFGMDTLIHHLYLLNRPLRILPGNDDTDKIVLEFRKKNTLSSEYEH